MGQCDGVHSIRVIILGIIIVFLDDWIIIFLNNTIYWLSGIFGGGQPLYPALHPLSASALARSPSTLAIGYFPIGGTHLLEADILSINKLSQSLILMHMRYVGLYLLI